MALILTVDDEASVRISIKNYLEDCDHDLIEAENGEEGLKQFLTHKPDLVLVDLKMPGMGGIELLTRILQESPTTPIIVVSGTGVLNDVVTALRSGAWNYLLKPIHELDVLKHAVDTALEKAQLVKENKSYQAHLENALEQRTQELANLVNNLPIGLYRANIDETSIIDMANPEIAKMFGYSDKEEFNHIKVEHLFKDPKESQEFLQKLFKNGRVNAEEVRMKRKDNSEFWGAITAHVACDDRGISTYVDGAIQDITNRKNAEADIQHKAYHDILTNLPNRSLLIERLQHDIALCQRKKTFGALLFIDLDHFKKINDALGHDIGDDLLIQVSQRLQKIIRVSDTIARLGGDEFVILLPDLHTHLESAGYQAKAVAEKAMQELAQHFELKGHTYQQTASIGIVTFPDPIAESVHDLLKWADTAMYNVKKTGRNNIRFFHLDMQQATEKRLKLERQLQQHIKDEKFSLYYQPQTDYHGNLIGAESLIRLEKKHIDISPAEFIPIAEETGLIVNIGNWVIEEALSMLKHSQTSSAHRLQHLSINVSARQFYQSDFISRIKSLITLHQVNPENIMLEITESILMDQIDIAVKNMNSLKTLGIKFSIDDFGTGFSSLAYLKKLPIDELKIDKSFIDDICTDNDSMILVKTIIGMAKQFKIKVVAEGVESKQQLDLLHEAGCDIFQGFYYAKPIESKQFIELITQKGDVINFRKTA